MESLVKGEKQTEVATIRNQLGAVFQGQTRSKVTRSKVNCYCWLQPSTPDVLPLLVVAIVLAALCFLHSTCTAPYVPVAQQIIGSSSGSTVQSRKGASGSVLDHANALMLTNSRAHQNITSAITHSSGQLNEHMLPPTPRLLLQFLNSYLCV